MKFDSQAQHSARPSLGWMDAVFFLLSYLEYWFEPECWVLDNRRDIKLISDSRCRCMQPLSVQAYEFCN